MADHLGPITQDHGGREREVVAAGPCQPCCEWEGTFAGSEASYHEHQCGPKTHEVGHEAGLGREQLGLIQSGPRTRRTRRGGSLSPAQACWKERVALGVCGSQELSSA
jgi:hypothetical protein